MIRIPVWVVVLFIVVVPTIIWAGDVMLPHVFMPETTIKAAEVNANFEALRKDIAASDRMVVSGGGVVKETSTDYEGNPIYLYATPLSHPLLDDNRDAIVFVTKDITNRNTPSRCYTNDDLECNVYYEEGRWWIYSTCSQLKYHVLIYSGPRANPAP